MALIYRHGGTTFHIVDIDAIYEREQRAVRTRFAKRPITGLQAIASTPLFAAFHPGEDDAFSIINADTDRVTAFGRTGAPQRMVVVAPDGSDAGRLIVLTHLFDTTGRTQAFVVSVELDSLHPESSRVPAGADALYVMPDAATIATWSANDAGDITLWPLGDTTLEAAIEAPALLLNGRFDAATSPLMTAEPGRIGRPAPTQGARKQRTPTPTQPPVQESADVAHHRHR